MEKLLKETHKITTHKSQRRKMVSM
ncbi:hypothetical protein BDFB_012385 [Asbolus verrucosus]|uniref:Uncharacterized protein n=1 Tax=Asbolus verrucosus TaxID=1661398 RepID=A0A482WBZ4_ASBVE|nr:hypothetical protein BDFB_012385 [Asbolus verrucosus]